MDIVTLLLSKIKEQHKWRLQDGEDGCSGPEIEDSFIMLKGGIIEELLYSGCQDYTLLAKIQNFN